MKSWRISYSKNNTGPCICGDNPIVLRNNNDFNLFSSELIFPLTKNKTLFYTNKEIKLKEIPPGFRLKLDMIVMDQLRLMAARINPDYLLLLNQMRKVFNMKELKQELFE
ncbi:hypothetical protein COB64_04535 [Candidatus Wolfebacteria bacterium]|nr:MAG: hypothetical protein COB64_04535 [Candidatus Wolfebacteria bacterium]